MIPAIREMPVIGKLIIGKDGRFTGVPGFVLYKIVGIDSHGGLLQFAKKIFSGKLTMAQILELLNPVRIAEVRSHSYSFINYFYQLWYKIKLI